MTLLPPRPQNLGSTDTGSLQREPNHGEGGEFCNGSILYVIPLPVTPTASPSSSSTPFRVHGASEAEMEGRRRLGVSTGPCPKVPARWPSVQPGLPRPAGERGMKAEPGKGGDPAKCLSAGSSKHMPLPRPADMHIPACTHSTQSSPWLILMGLGGKGRCSFQPTQDHSPPAEAQRLFRGLS